VVVEAVAPIVTATEQAEAEQADIAPLSWAKTLAAAQRQKVASSGSLLKVSKSP